MNQIAAPSSPLYASPPGSFAVVARGGAARAALVLTFAGAFAPLWIWSDLPAGRFDAPASFALGVALYCALRLAVFAYTAQPRLLAITFHAFVYIWGGLAPFAQNYTDIFPWGVRHVPGDELFGMLQVVLALSAYEAGQLLAHRRPLRHFAPVHFQLSHRAVFWVCVAALPLLAIGMMMLGGPQILFRTRAAYGFIVAGETVSKMQGLVGSSLFRVPIFVALLLVSIVCKRDWRTMSTSRRRTFLLLLLYTAALNVVGNWPLSLTRQWLGTVVLTPVFALIAWRRWQVAALGAGLIALILFVFPYADAFRRQITFSVDVVESALQRSVVDNILNKGDFDVYQQSLNAIAVVEHEGHTYGKNFVGAVGFWFPRALWHGKPDGTGIEVARKVGYPWHQTNLSAPLWMEFYWAFGWIGIGLLMGLYGLGCAHLDRAFIRARAQNVATALVLVFVPFYAAYQFIMVRGDILNGTAQAAPALVLFLLAAKLRRGPTTER